MGYVAELVQKRRIVKRGKFLLGKINESKCRQNRF